MELTEKFTCVGQFLKEEQSEYEYIAKIALVGCQYRDMGRKEYLSTRMIKE